MRDPSHMMHEAGDQGMLPEVSFKLPGPPQCSQKLLLYAAHLHSTFLLQHVAYTFLNICVSQIFAVQPAGTGAGLNCLLLNSIAVQACASRYL